MQSKNENKTTSITKEFIDNAFESATEQSEYLINLYRKAFPDFDKMESVGGFPIVSTETWTYICRKAIEFDEKHHKNQCISGGLWMNCGFSSDEHLGLGIKDWEIDISKCKPVYK